VIDVWDWGWDERLGTIHPREINKAAIIASKLYSQKRFIIHYLQPHDPYLTLTTKGIGPKLKKEEIWQTKRRRSLWDRVRGFIRWRLVDLFGYELGRKLAIKLVGYPKPTKPNRVELVAREIGVEGSRKAYENNLRIVLHYVNELIKNLHGKIVITADHGELLGERGYGHPMRRRFPELIEVPWLEISGD